MVKMYLKGVLIVSIIIIALSCSFCKQSQDTSQLPSSGELSLIPIPDNCEYRKGRMEISSKTRIVITSEELASLAKLFSDEIEQLISVRLSVAKEKPRSGDIVMELKPELKEEEYMIDINKKAVISGGSPNAVSYGTVTMLQAFISMDGNVGMPRMKIKDKPAVGYRGLSLDVAREPHSLNTLKQAVVMCRWYKIKYLQLHLTDNEGFTFPTTAYPQLRSSDINQQGKRHFSLEEFCELEDFARDRGVVIIPEIELPGHGMAILRGMPELFGGPPRNDRHQAICVGKERVYEVLDTIIGEICNVFRTTPYFHIGADEVIYDNWDYCPETKKFMAAHKIDDYIELYRYFIVRMNDIVKKHGKKTIAWEGFQKEGKIQIPRDITVMVYECKFNLPQDLVADGYDVINAAWQPLYVTPGRAWEPEYIYKSWNVYRWENWWDQSKAFPDGIEVSPTSKVLGAEMVTWSMPDDKEIPALRERLAAMGERLWNPGAGRTFADFAARFSSTDGKLMLLLP
jgi:hexosaminidase